MTYVTVAIGVFFICIAFVVTEKNAKYLLSGYNTMSDEERKDVDIKGLMAHFKYFFIFLGVSFLLGSLVLQYYVSANASALFICVYPVIACIYLLISSGKFYQKKGSGKS